MLHKILSFTRRFTANISIYLMYNMIQTNRTSSRSFPNPLLYSSVNTWSGRRGRRKYFKQWTTECGSSSILVPSIFDAIGSNELLHLN